MADKPTAAPTAGQPAGTQSPAPSGGTPAAPGVIKGGTPRETADKFSDNFGGRALDPWEDPVPEPEIAEEEASPPAGAHADTTEATETVTTAAAEEQPAGPDKVAAEKPAPTKPDLPDDGVLQELDAVTLKLGGLTDSPAPTTTETDDADAKALADESAPLEKRLEHAQSLIGKHRTELGDLRKFKGQAETAFRDLGQYFAFDQQTQTVKPTAGGLLKLAEFIDPHELNQALANQKLKVVPLDWKPEAVVSQDDTDKDFEEVVNVLVAGTDLTFEEKLAEINSQPKLAAKLHRELASRSAKRTINTEREIAERTLRTQQQQGVEDGKVMSFFDGLIKLPYFKTELAPAIKHWHDTIPRDRPLGGELRAQVLYRLGQLNRMKSVLSAEVQKAYQRGLNDSAGKAKLAGTMPQGEVPTHVDMSQQPRRGAGAAAFSDKEAAAFI